MNGKGKMIAVISGSIVLIMLIGILMLSMFFRVKEISYTGNTKYTDEELTEMIFNGKYNANVLTYYLFSSKLEKVSIPFIQEYDVSLIWPDKLEVTVYEKNIIGYINYMECNMYFDKDGIVVDSSREKLEDIPEVTGIDYKNIVLYQKLDVKHPQIFQVMLDIIQLFKKYEIKLDKVHFDSYLNATVNCNGVDVELGGMDNLNEKINELSQMLPELEGKRGVLNLSNYNEDMTSFIFKAYDEAEGELSEAEDKIEEGNKKDLEESAG